MTRHFACFVSTIALAAVILSVPSIAAESISQETTTASATALPAGVQLVDKGGPEQDELGIAYELYELDNGLTVLLHKDTSDPVVHVEMTYHVGSAREEIGRSGFAHFFEHMMFEGSANAADGAHAEIVEAAGGRLNGSTSPDRTNYFQTIPSNHLEKVLWLEADRMGFLLPAVTQEKFEIQRATVKNERGQRVDNAPYGILRERIGEILYPQGHPYSWSTIGYLEDLDRADLDDLKNFFRRWYGPNNAVLAIAGDFDTRQTLEWVVKYFGSIERGPEVEKAQPEIFFLEGDRYITVEDKVPAPLLSISFPTVHIGHLDEAPLDVLMSILAQGKSSILQQNLQAAGLVSRVFGRHGCLELHCTFDLQATQKPDDGRGLAFLEGKIEEGFADFERRGVRQDDIDKFAASIRTISVLRMDGVVGKVAAMVNDHLFHGSPDETAARLATYESVTPADVMRVYERYIKSQGAAIVSIVPDGRADLAVSPQNWTIAPRNIPEIERGEIAERTLPTDSFDRSIVPEASGELSIAAPPLWRGKLDNGIMITGIQNDETPLTSLRIYIKAGQRHETLETLGVSSLIGLMMEEATQLSESADLKDRLQRLGSTVAINPGVDHTIISLTSLTENLDETVSILAEQLFKPAFRKEDLERLKSVRLANFERLEQEVRYLAETEFSRLLFGEANVVAYDQRGTSDTVAALTVDDIKAFYEDRFAPDVASIIVVSDLPADEIKESLRELSNWEGAAKEIGDLSPFPQIVSGTIYLIDRPGAAQSYIQIGRRGVPSDANGEYTKLVLVNDPLGGGLRSRVNSNLREEKGYTYGARTRFQGYQEHGSFSARSAVRTDATADAIREFLIEIERYHREGPTQEELALSRTSHLQSDVLTYESSFGKLLYLTYIDRFGLDEDFAKERDRMISGFTLDEAKSLAAKFLDPDEMIIVVAGDKEKIFESLQMLDRKIVELQTGP